MRVQLYVYDLSQGMARAMSMQFLGVQLDLVPHTGIVVYGQEYFYSGGLQAMPKDAFAHARGLPSCEIVDLGDTEVPQEIFEEFVDARREDFTAQTYDLLRHNCNHFTEEAAQFLLGKSIPESIRKVPEIVMATPMGAMFAQMLEGTANGFDPLQGGGRGGMVGGIVGDSVGGGGGESAMSTADILGALGSVAPAPAAPSTPRAAEPSMPSEAVTSASTPRANAFATSTPRAGGSLASLATATPRATPATHPTGPNTAQSSAEASGGVPTAPKTAPRAGHALSLPPPPSAPDGAVTCHAADEATPATNRRPAATPFTRVNPMAPLAATPAVPLTSDGPARGRMSSSLPVLVTPAAAPRAPFTYPSLQPLTAKDGPIAPVTATGYNPQPQTLTLTLTTRSRRWQPHPPADRLHRARSVALAQVIKSLSKAVSTSALPAAERAAFTAALQAAFDDPNLIDDAAAQSLASGVRALLACWPPSNLFSLLYLARLLAAFSEATSRALLTAGVPRTLLGPGGALAAATDGALATAPRAARLMSLALLTNLASRAATATSLVRGIDPGPCLTASPAVPGAVASAAPAACVDCEDERGVPAGTGGAAFGLEVVAAATAALGEASDTALCQMGAALAYNVSLHLTRLPAAAAPLRSALAAALLGGVLGTLAALTDQDALGRALSVLGHLLHERRHERRPSAKLAHSGGGGEDQADAHDSATREEIRALALSLDAAEALAQLETRAADLGHGTLLADVRALLGC